MSRHATIGAAMRALVCAAVVLLARPLGAQERSGPAAGESAERPKPLAGLSSSATSVRDSLVALARAQLGRRYRFGGQSPEGGFDCSGLVRYVMAALDVRLPRTASQQDHAGMALQRDTSTLRPGDLLTFGSGRRASHIGIYIGNGRYIHASSKAGRVIESPIDRPPHPLIKKWRGARRVVLTPDSSLVAQQPAVRSAM